MLDTENGHLTKANDEKIAYANEWLFNSFRGVKDNAEGSFTKETKGAQKWHDLLMATPRR